MVRCFCEDTQIYTIEAMFLDEKLKTLSTDEGYLNKISDANPNGLLIDLLALGGGLDCSHYGLVPDKLTVHQTGFSQLRL
jgi:hypothetical protein